MIRVSSQLFIPTDMTAAENNGRPVIRYLATGVQKNLALEEDCGASIDLSLNTSTYVLTFSLKNKAGTVISSDTIDFPIESMVVNATYSNGILTLYLQNGNTVDVDISDIVSGLVNDVKVDGTSVVNSDGEAIITLSNFVTLNTEQQITGAKSFTQPIEVTGNIKVSDPANGTVGIQFQRGTDTDSYNDWKIVDEGGSLKFYDRNGNSGWRLQFSLSNDAGILGGKVYFSAPSSISDISSGDTLPTLFGKIKKWYQSIQNIPTELKQLNNRNQAYITWGGNSITGSVSTIETATIDDLRGNKFAFASAATVVVQYSRDGGETWVDYGASNANKRSLLTTSASFFIGGRTGANNTVNDQLRVILNSNRAGGNVYCWLRRLLLHISTNGSTGCKVKLERRLISNYNNNVDAWEDGGTTDISGWSGWNSIKVDCSFGGNSTQTSQTAQIRLTFSVAAVSTTNSNLQLLRVRSIASILWTSPSTMASTGHLYSYDIDQNATFPANITATGKLLGNSSDATVAFTEAADVQNVATGETHATLWGKVKKWFTDKISKLKALAFKDKVEAGDYTAGSITSTDVDSTIAKANDLNDLLKLDGSNTMTGKLNLKATGNNETNIGDNGIRWGSTSLPQDTSPQYLCTIDAFASGGRQKWASIADVKSAIGVPTKTSDLTNDSDFVTATELAKKVNDMTIGIYNGTAGNPKPVRFMSVDYNNCGSEEGVFVRVSMVSGHGNGISYVFLQDAFFNVSYTGNVSVNVYKYFGQDTTYNGVARQYGDIFWVINTTNKVVDFYALMGQYSTVYSSPYKRLNASTKGVITQYTSGTVYSSGAQEWANQGNFVRRNEPMAGWKHKQSFLISAGSSQRFQFSASRTYRVYFSGKPQQLKTYNGLDITFRYIDRNGALQTTTTPIIADGSFVDISTQSSTGSYGNVVVNGASNAHATPITSDFNLDQGITIVAYSAVYCGGDIYEFVGG